MTLQNMQVGTLQIDKAISRTSGVQLTLTSAIPTVEGKMIGKVPVWMYKGVYFSFVLCLN